MNNANFREWAGVAVAAFVVVMFGFLGYVQIAIEAFVGIKVSVPESWNSSMVSLSSAAIGYLIGKQSSGSALPVNQFQGTTTIQAAPESASVTPPVAKSTIITDV